MPSPNQSNPQGLNNTSAFPGDELYGVYQNIGTAKINYGDLVAIDTTSALSTVSGVHQATHTDGVTTLIGVCTEQNGITTGKTGQIQTRGINNNAVAGEATVTAGDYLTVDAGGSPVAGTFANVASGTSNFIALTGNTTGLKFSVRII